MGAALLIYLNILLALYLACFGSPNLAHPNGDQSSRRDWNSFHCDDFCHSTTSCAAPFCHLCHVFPSYPFSFSFQAPFLPSSSSFYPLTCVRAYHHRSMHGAALSLSPFLFLFPFLSPSRVHVDFLFRGVPYDQIHVHARVLCDERYVHGHGAAFVRFPFCRAHSDPDFHGFQRSCF